ncbi:MAG: hypothetical protein JW861_13740 [Bacteroidales bacterium]|nr:hypothetical protein [Bacteroidales bacterium]
MLRISYYTGALADTILGIGLLFPQVSLPLLGLSISSGDPVFRFISMTGGVMMLGWTAVLLWASLKPEERSMILLITVFPVIAGLMTAGVIAFLFNALPLEKFVMIWIFQLLLAFLFLFSFFYAKPNKTNRV